MEELFNKEGIRDVQIKPIGGRFLILTLSNEEARDVAIKEKWLHYWFEEIKPWNGEAAKDERFAWITCYGMPVNA